MALMPVLPSEANSNYAGSWLVSLHPKPTQGLKPYHLKLLPQPDSVLVSTPVTGLPAYDKSIVLLMHGGKASEGGYPRGSLPIPALVVAPSVEKA